MKTIQVIGLFGVFLIAITFWSYSSAGAQATVNSKVDALMQDDSSCSSSTTGSGSGGQ